MGVDPKRPLVGFALVALLCAGMMVLSMGRGVGAGLFGPGRPLVAPAVVDQQDRVPEPVAAPATVTIPAELSAEPLGVARAGPLPTESPSPAAVPAAEPAAEPAVAEPEEVEVAPTNSTSADRHDAKADRNADRRGARAERKAERRAARAAQRTQREAARAEHKAHKAARKADRDAAKAAREADRDAVKAARDEAKAAPKG